MKQINTIFIFIIFCAVISFAQSGWFFQNPKPQGNDLKDLSFCDRSNGWAVGVFGTILHTTDGGLSWEIQKSGTKSHFYGIVALTPSTAVSVGTEGTIVKTIDGGLTWNKIESNTTAALFSVCFINSQIGYSIEFASQSGNKVLKTTDAGDSWVLLNTNITEYFSSIHFANPDTGYAVGGFWGTSIIIKTTDGGSTWFQQANPTSYSLYSVQAMDTVAWAVGYDGVILKTIKSGTEWITINAGNILTKDLYTVNFYNYGLGFAAGAQGETKKSIDGGYTWTTIMSDYINYKTMRKIQMVDSLIGYAVGEKGKMMKTSNGGLNWVHLDNAVKPELWAVWFTDENNGTAVGDVWTQIGGWTDGVFYQTSDGGNNWSLSTSITNTTFEGLHYPTQSVGYAVGYNGRNAVVAKTNSGGSTWNLDTIKNYWGRLWSVFFHDAVSGVAVGDSGVVMRTTNGGITWIRENNVTNNNLFFVYFSYNLPDAAPEDTGYVGFAVGSNGTVLKSNNAGESWASVTIPTTNSINGVFIVPRKVIWLVGNSNTIYKSTSAGVYDKLSSPSYSDWAAVYAPDENNACLAGSYGHLIQTTDGGTNWVDHKFTLNTLRAVHFKDSKTGWIVGEAGTILKTNDGGGITEVKEIEFSNEIPKAFVLEQNYPNPFNPSTVISYQLPVNSNVILKVFDILGNEVTTLVNEEQNAGTYNYTFSIINYQLPSGIYFYQIKTRSFVQARKMLLLK